MTSATTTPARGMSGGHAGGYGLIVFASAWCLMIIAVNVVALSGLCTFGSSENLAA